MEFRNYKSYPEYKDSGVEWIGEVPVDWETIKLKRIFTIYNGSTPNSGVEQYWNGNMLWATPDDLGQLQGQYLYNTRKSITREGYLSCGTSLIPKNNLILSIRAPIGHLAITGYNICINQGCKGLIFNKNVSIKYFYFLLLALKKELESWGQGSTFQELSRKNLQKIVLLKPSINEQHKIAFFLDYRTTQIDQLIQEKQELIELLKKKKTALITKCVTKGLDDNVKMKDSGVEWIGKMPKHWDITQLKRFISNIESGTSVNAIDEAIEPYNKSEFGVLKTSAVFKENLNINENKKVLDAETERCTCPLVSNTLIVSRMNTPDLVASAGYSEKNVNNIFLPDRLWQIKTEPSIKTKFLFYFTLSVLYRYQVHILACGTSSSMVNLSQHEFGSIIITVPSVKEQTELIDYLDNKTSKIDQSIQEIQDSIDYLKRYRTSLITAAVTGKIDVRDWEQGEILNKEAAHA